MSSLFPLKKSLTESKQFEPLSYEDIKSSGESVNGASWKDIVTPDRSIVSFNISASSFASHNADPQEIKRRLEQITASKNFTLNKNQDRPAKLDESTNPIYNPTDSNEFLRRKTLLSDSVRKSAQSIVELALTGKSNDGLPDHITMDLVVEVIKKGSKIAKRKPTAEDLLKFVQILNEEDCLGTPDTDDDSGMLKQRLRQSQNEVFNLNRTLGEYKSQISTFQSTLESTFNQLKELCQELVNQKKETDYLKEQLKKPNEEISILKKALLESERLLDSERKGRLADMSSLGILEQRSMQDLVEQNKQLKMQVQQNLETFDKLAEHVKKAENLEKILIMKEHDINVLKKDKVELIEAVEQLVESAQKIMESSKGSKLQKLRQFEEIFGSMKSISLSDLQH